MTNKRGMKLLLTLGLVVFALALFTPVSWAGKPVDNDEDGVTENKDCNDNEPTIYPGAPELCDGIDNQCPGDPGYGFIDEGCSACTDADGDGYSIEGNSCGAVDCDDSNPDINPGATEVCNNNVDDNCNGEVDEGCPTCTDYDGDGYFAEAGCGTPQDCDDGDDGVHPGAVEICDNGIDENCDSRDQACCTDADGDSYSIPYAESECGPVDCNDDNVDVHPGAVEICDGVDNQCPGDSGYGLTDEVCSACSDNDSDGYFAEAACGTAVDCDDSDGTIYPGADEYCNAVDDNCDGQVDEGCAAATDSDEDGLSDAIERSGFVLNSDYMLWTGSGWDNSSTITIPGYSGCSGKCLDPSKKDLFVAWRPLETDSRVDLTTCNIFEFASNPISIGGADYNVWVTKEKTVPAATRRITENPADSEQMLVLIIEDDSTSGSATGISQPGTIMVEGMGKGWIKTHKIELNIDNNCLGETCKDADGVPYSPPYTELKCLHKKNTAIHEVWHVLSALNSPDMHIDDADYIMYGTVLFTEKGPKKTYYIGDEFSPAGLNDPCFY